MSRGRTYRHGENVYDLLRRLWCNVNERPLLRKVFRQEGTGVAVVAVSLC
jgi:hypothetical protein